MSSLQVTDLRNIAATSLDLEPGLNVLVGRNAQGKTSLLEALALLARGRSFRTEDVRALVRRGQPGLHAEALAHGDGREMRLGVHVSGEGRRLFVDGREVRPREYHGRLEVVVYATDRLRVIRGPMKERRLFLDRAAGALWPSFRQIARDYERVLAQRNAALESGGRGLEPWNERFAAVGAVLRTRRGRYVERLRGFLAARENPAGERYDIVLAGGAGRTDAEEKDHLLEQMKARARDEQRVRRSLVGPHRDEVGLTVDGEEVAVAGSSGQARSVLLALCLAMLDLHRTETGTSALALLDDLDSELDEERATALCHEVVRTGQAVVTTAHPGWARRLADAGRVFEVEDGRVRAA